MGNIPWLQYIRLFAFQLVQQAVFIFCRKSILNVLSVGTFSMYTKERPATMKDEWFLLFSLLFPSFSAPHSHQVLESPYLIRPVAANLCASWGSLSVPKRMFFTHCGDGGHHFLQVFLRFCGPYFSVIVMCYIDGVGSVFKFGHQPLKCSPLVSQLTTQKTSTDQF